MEDLFKAHESANSALQVYEDMKGGSGGGGGGGAPAYTSPAYTSPTSTYTPASEKKSSSGPVPPPLLDLADDVSNPLLIQSMTPVVSAKGPASPRVPPTQQQPSISPPRKGPPSTAVMAPPAPAPAVSLIEQDDPFKSDVTDPFGAGGSSIDTLLTPSHTDYTATTTSPTTQAPSRPSANDDILALFTTPAASTTTSAPPVPYQYQPSTNQHTY